MPGDRWAVRLTRAEFDAGAAEGSSRVYEHATRKYRALKSGLKSSQTDSANWGRDMIGALGEAAAHKLLCPGTVWRPAPEKEPDINGWIDVRTTDYAGGHLLLHEYDQPERPFLLMVGGACFYRAVGWVWLCHGGIPDHWQTNPRTGERPAYWVPQGKLSPVKTLFELNDWKTKTGVIPPPPDRWEQDMGRLSAIAPPARNAYNVNR